MGDTTLVWLRNDLRVRDNPALAAALATGRPVVALYIHETDPALRPIGAAARWWLHHSLRALAGDLGELGVALEVVTGSTRDSVMAALDRHKGGALFWNRRYAPAAREVDAAIKAEASNRIGQVKSYPGNLLVEPWDIATGSGSPYSVFTPFWKSLKARHVAPPAGVPRTTLRPIAVRKAPDAGYSVPAWARRFQRFWEIGEDAARERLADFLEDELPSYAEGRDLPGKMLTSRLSPYLRFGEISARQIWHSGMALAQRQPELAGQVDKFLSELAWRDFSHNLLYHRADIAREPMQAKYANLRWRQDEAGLDAWRRGRTGIPIIDAGMRQLWTSGWMHNRVRMLVASLLSKNLLIDWRLGEEWFWDCLVDADEANNPSSWQWVAGCGADAAPYFRIFNPVTQGEKFDPDGRYVREWVPELENLPPKWVHRPHEAPREVLERAGIVLGETYPAPIVDLGFSRQRALDAVKDL